MARGSGNVRRLRSPPLGRPKAETLVDPMHGSSLNATLWGTVIGTVSESSSGLLITNPVNYTGYGGMTSVLPYDMTGSSFSVRLVDPGNETINSWEVQLVAQIDSSNYLQWLLNKNSFLAQYKLAGVVTNPGTLTYNPAIHKYFRIREASGTIFWDWSTDGITWTNLTSHANPFAVTALKAVLSVGTYNLETTATSATFDNFGGPPSVAPVAITASATAVGVASAAVTAPALLTPIATGVAAASATVTAPGGTTPQNLTPSARAVAGASAAVTAPARLTAIATAVGAASATVMAVSAKSYVFAGVVLDANALNVTATVTRLRVSAVRL